MKDYEEIMNSGKLYKVMELTKEETHYYEFLQQMETYNSLGYTDEAEAEKKEILKGLFAEVGENAYIQAPFHGMWGGHHVHLGKNVYINFNCTFVDDAQIYIGDGTMLAPNVTIITASHPVSPKLRAEGYGCNKPVYIGENVWIASNVTILPGVHIGNNSIIGAGSLVNKDIPENVIVYGNPAKVIREITPEDDIYYDHGKLIRSELEKMKDHIIIRLEKPEDYEKTENLVRESFWNVYRPGCLEHYVLHCLRTDDDFVPELDFVMEKDGEMIGQNVFVRTAIAADDGRSIPIMTMGPIAISQEYKRQGYGKKLLDYSLEKAKEMGAGAVCFEGNIDFYGKSGFVCASEKGIRYHGVPEGEDASFFLCKELIPGYFDGITGVYTTPSGYLVDESEAEKFDLRFPPKEKKKLPGQLF